jgi:hypothetical protein
MAQLLAGGVYHRFHRFDRVHMEGLRTILAGTKFTQSSELIEFCEIMTSELQPSCGVMRKPLSQGRARRDLFAPQNDLCLSFETPRPDPIHQHATAVVTYGFSVGCIATTVIERAHPTIDVTII